MKIALCLSGQARFLEACYYESMKPNIIDDLNPDVFYIILYVILYYLNNM